MKHPLFTAPALALLLSVSVAGPGLAQQPRTPTAAAIDREARLAMQATGTRGLAIAVIDEGEVAYVASYGARNAAGDALRPDTVMYGASLTKAVFAWMVMQLVDEGRLDLDRPIAEILPRPLPEYTGAEVEDLYARWSDLAGDDRWRALTPRMLLSNAPGFANFGFMEPDGVLRFHFQPGARYSYSGDGFILLQFALEKGLGLDLEQEMQRRVFQPLGMTRTSMMWRADFAGDLADGWDLAGKPEPHDERSAPRAAGSLDTTIRDFSRFAVAYASGQGLSPAARRELTRAQLPITVASQFPVLQDELAPADRRPDLAAGLGVVVFDGPQGPAFMKGGGNDVTANTWVCVEAGRRCVALLSNDASARAAFPHLVAFILGDTGAPWTFEYGDLKFWTP